MGTLVLEIRAEEFDEYPLRLPEDALVIHGTHISATLDVSLFAFEHGRELDHYLSQLEATILRSRFRLHYQLLVQNISPPELSVDLSRVHFTEVNFEHTDLSQSRLSGAIQLTRCLVDPSLPPISIKPGEVFRYPPIKAAKELGVTDPKDIFVLRWGLGQDARHVGQAFLWLERRYPNTESVLARLLKGLPARPARRLPWSP